MTFLLVSFINFFEIPISVEHLTHFTDMLGASHSSNYTLWKIGEPSTDGMKEIAEWGNTYKAEIEAKEKVGMVSSTNIQRVLRRQRFEP